MVSFEIQRQYSEQKLHEEHEQYSKPEIKKINYSFTTASQNAQPISEQRATKKKHSHGSSNAWKKTATVTPGALSVETQAQKS